MSREITRFVVVADTNLDCHEVPEGHQIVSLSFEPTFSGECLSGSAILRAAKVVIDPCSVRSLSTSENGVFTNVLSSKGLKAGRREGRNTRFSAFLRGVRLSLKATQRAFSASRPAWCRALVITASPAVLYSDTSRFPPMWRSLAPIASAHRITAQEDSELAVHEQINAAHPLRV